MKQEQIIVLELSDKIYALNLEFVERVIYAIEITLLPKVPDIILGVINYQDIPVEQLRF